MRIPNLVPMPKGGFRHSGGHPWPGTWDSDQRRYVIQYAGKTYRVARLICEAFHGPAPFSEAVVMHLDEDPTNNVPSNLRWGTQKENLNAPGFLHYCSQRTGNANPRCKGRRKWAHQSRS
jgi:hypothetical protein